MGRVSSSRTGFFYGFAAYGLWGLLPLFWALLDHVGSLEVLAHRVVWSLIVVLVLLALARRLGRIRGLGARAYTLLAVAGVIMTVNWGTYIWAVSQGRVIETSLGYFINPLVTVLVAVIVLRERLRRPQWAAMAIAMIAVVILTVNYGQPPWIGLTLAFTFSFYSLIKKKLRVPAVESVAVESAAMFLPALIFLITLQFTGDADFGHVDLGTDMLFMATGVAPGSRVLDLCAGPGGKATYLAQLVGPDGPPVTAVELHPHRAELVRSAAARQGVAVDVHVGDAADPPLAPDATFECEQRGRMGECPQLILYYMHGLGHGIGLDVHDPWPPVLEPGTAFTIEPGVYVRPNLFTEVIPDTRRNRRMMEAIGPAYETYRNIGVRIEDDYLVTERGAEWLSRAPREIAEVEAEMAR
jgi:chloramphenicol-sensitive protein RarD